MASLRKRMRVAMCGATWMLGSCLSFAQERDVPSAVAAPVADEAIAGRVEALSREVLAASRAGEVEVAPTSLAHLQLVAGTPADAEQAVAEVVRGLEEAGDVDRARRWVPYLLHARASEVGGTVSARDEAYRQAYRAHFAGLDDLAALKTQYWFVGDSRSMRDQLRQALARQQGQSRIPRPEVLELARRQAFVAAYDQATRLAGALGREDLARRFSIDDTVMIPTPQGATLSAVVVRPHASDAPAPTAMLFTIYADPDNHLATAAQAAARGYVGVVVDARGKRLGQDAIRPYETEADDAAAAVEWIARQPWSDGRVAMYGGSYSGFAAWASAKRMPAALKTIVPYVAAIPGLGVPMENNVFLVANYAWPFYVASNRLLDNAVYADRERWRTLATNWYASGRPFREIDQVDGTPNPWLQRWLSHPDYDAYWQAMVPYGDEFARIDIPVLSITGYYDDGQVSALQYYKEHLRHRPDARHVLLIGPYDHFGAQAPVKARNLGGYDIDPVAQFDTEALTFQWLDHVLRGGPRPALLPDAVNYQLMGANAWGHAPSLDAAARATTFHLSGEATGAYHRLSRTDPGPIAPLRQVVDFADRRSQSHAYYPSPIVRDRLEVDSGFAFASEPFMTPTDVVGTFSGELKVRIDKRDFDFTVVLYELMADGRAMQLSYSLGRASHARDMTRRELLVPGEWTTVPFGRSRMTGRSMEAGSRLLVVVDVVKDANHQVNMGTGKDVSDESIADAGTPLTIEWHPDSVIRIPLGGAVVE